MTDLSTTNETKDICNAQWLLLWTTAAYSPENPNKDDKATLETFFDKFQDLCRTGPHANVYENSRREHGPVPVSSRRELMLWLCMAENRGLSAAGLPTKRCRYRELVERWRYVDGYL
uniref:Sulfhydryl oxidase n=1 Tax=Noctiluca scintillans TaxID=2966 RepID=A0A7S1FIW2_NOCSC|mmetsp:Transcript_65090/g.172419  ORF Transcript_65090/g.172419 Transcript_65090/m.172419 type:complete len:117 (+) Transcript_65090:74-424(+)